MAIPGNSGLVLAILAFWRSCAGCFSVGFWYFGGNSRNESFAYKNLERGIHPAGGVQRVF